MKTAYDGYRYIFYECAGKKLTPKHWSCHLRANTGGGGGVCRFSKFLKFVIKLQKVKYGKEFKQLAVT